MQKYVDEESVHRIIKLYLGIMKRNRRKEILEKEIVEEFHHFEIACSSIYWKETEPLIS